MPLSVIILPPGSKLEAPYPNVAKGFDIVGIGTDVAEATSALFNFPILPDTLAYVDIGAELIASIANGDSFIGYPEAEGAPYMVVVGQDVWLTALEAGGVTLAKEALFVGGTAVGGLPGAVVGYVAGNFLDAGTSAASAVYDLGRLQGAFPNVVSFAIYFDSNNGG